MGRRTPWGTAQHEVTIAPGIVQVDTASHGGIHLDAALNRKVHKAWRRDGGWYEEDCDWSIVAVTFPEHFTDPMSGIHEGKTLAEYAHHVARNWLPDEYEQVQGVALTAAESHMRAEQQIAASVADKVCTFAAWGAGQSHDGRMVVPDGYVGVVACLGGRWRRREAEEVWLLIEETEYEQRPYPQGLVIDPDRHAVWPAIPTEDHGHPATVFVGADTRPCRPPVRLGDRYTYKLFGAAHPHLGCEVGELWEYPAVGDSPHRWRALRRFGNSTGAWLDSSPTRELALAAVGFRLPPVADRPDEAAIAAIFAEFLATT